MTGMPKKAFSHKQTPLARQNIVKKGGKDVYLSLALFNETTSPLIKAYKQGKGYALFQYKYKTMDKVLQDVRASYNNIRASAILGVEQYLSLHDFQSWSHGEAGQKRAQAFLNLLYQENYNTDNLPRDFYELFANNSVNGTREGWSWFDKIRSGSQSLFTVVSQCIIPRFCTDQIDPRIRDLAAKSPLPTGPDKALQRLMHKAIALGIVAQDCERQIEEHSAELLKAVQKS